MRRGHIMEGVVLPRNRRPIYRGRFKSFDYAEWDSLTPEEKRERAHQRKVYLKRNTSPMEEMLGSSLRAMGFKITPQKQFYSKYLITVDFYIEALHLVVELDGKQHLNRVEKDAYRDKCLIQRYGVAVFRVPSTSYAQVTKEMIEYCAANPRKSHSFSSVSEALGLLRLSACLANKQERT